LVAVDKGKSLKLIPLIQAFTDTQEFAGSVCIATYTEPEPLSAIGMFYVLPSLQGRGIGSYLFDEAIKLCAPRKFLYGGKSLNFQPTQLI
jgi:GNAT superfamily N-acetyltransferase